jgi:hypothetical protein
MRIGFQTRHPQASVLNEPDRREGRVWHRYAEDKRERVAYESLAQLLKRIQSWKYSVFPDDLRKSVLWQCLNIDPGIIYKGARRKIRRSGRRPEGAARIPRAPYRRRPGSRALLRKDKA